MWVASNSMPRSETGTETSSSSLGTMTANLSLPPAVQLPTAFSGLRLSFTLLVHERAFTAIAVLLHYSFYRTTLALVTMEWKPLRMPPVSWPHPSNPVFHMQLYHLPYLGNYMNIISFVYFSRTNDQWLQVKHCTYVSKGSEKTSIHHIPPHNCTAMVNTDWIIN